ncbi:hypothetical protein PTKU15_85330 [Paraburkholderia terrae]|nr:hypothetical protein PTKU15_85330 [Paraburkholderia terrae]
MLLYLKGALNRRLELGQPLDEATLLEAIREGAVQRVRPKAMTVAVVLAGLIPIMVGHGAGSEVMQRIAAPMVGGMVTAPILSMFVIPAAWLLLQRRRVARSQDTGFSHAVPFGAKVSSTETGELMKKMIVAYTTFAAVVAAPAFADDGMAGMSMSGKPSAMKAPSSTMMTDAEVKNVDAAASMVTLKHGAIENVGMPPMTMAFKVKDADMIKRVREGDKVKVRVENVGG